VLDSIYDSIDADHTGAITFYELWRWFIHEARDFCREKRNGKKPLFFTVKEILTPSERAAIVLMQRFAERDAKSYFDMGLVGSGQAFEPL
jgi:hypothetical protein